MSSLIPVGGRRGTVVSRQANREREDALALEDARTTVNLARVVNVARVGNTAITMAAAINRAAETASTVVPEERHRTDAIAEMVAASMLSIVAEQGQQAR